MFYLEIIFKTILSFIIDLVSLKISISILIIFFIFSYLLILLWKNIKKITVNYKFIITIIRVFIIFLIFPLFQNNNFKFEEEKFEEQNIGVIVDNSKSILNTYSITDINNILDSISIWGNNNNLNLYWYNLDSSIKRTDLILDNNSTNFSSFPNFSIFNNLDQLIILSDGNINKGSSISSLIFSDNIVVNTIGLGPINDNQNANIIDVKVDNNQDSIISKIKFRINSNIDNQKAIFNIYSDSYKNKIYSDTLLIMKGDYFFDKKVVLNKSIINNKLIFNLNPITFLNTDKNTSDWEINFNNNRKDKILLLTGSINYNTSFLKNILNSNIDFELVHHILFNDDNYLVSEEFDCVILDNFFTSNSQLEIVNDLYSSGIPIIFFEGVNSKPNYLKPVIDLFYKEEFYLEDKNKNKNVLIDDIDIGPIKSNFSLFLKDNKISDKIIFFADSSIALLSSNKFSLVLMPNIAEIDFYLKNKYNENYLSKYISFLITQHSNNSPINLRLDKNNYLKDEQISFDIQYDIPFKEENRQIVIENLNKGSIDSLLYNDESIFLNDQGDYKIYFLYKGTNGEVINSNIESFSVNNYSVELSKISQNRILLKNFSEKFNGNYIDITDFNYTYFSNLNTVPNYKKYNYIFSALDIFVREKIYLLVIILLSLEIYLRKRVGLL